MAENDTTHEGWSNKPTWLTNLWISNEEPLYREATRRVRQAIRDAIEKRLDDEHGPDGDPSAEDRLPCNQDREDAASAFADDLETWLDELLFTDETGSIQADFMRWAVAHVDFLEVSRNWVDAEAGEILRKAKEPKPAKAPKAKKGGRS